MSKLLFAYQSLWVRKAKCFRTCPSKKGEAELPQVDWLADMYKRLKPGKSVVRVVTSGDIDRIVIHLFAISLHWLCYSDSTFKNTVYVLLKKQTPEPYNVTCITERLEKYFK